MKPMKKKKKIKEEEEEVVSVSLLLVFLCIYSKYNTDDDFDLKRQHKNIEVTLNYIQKAFLQHKYNIRLQFVYSYNEE